MSIVLYKKCLVAVTPDGSIVFIKQDETEIIADQQSINECLDYDYNLSSKDKLDAGVYFCDIEFRYFKSHTDFGTEYDSEFSVTNFQEVKIA